MRTPASQVTHIQPGDLVLFRGTRPALVLQGYIVVDPASGPMLFQIALEGKVINVRRRDVSLLARSRPAGAAPAD